MVTQAVLNQTRGGLAVRRLKSKYAFQFRGAWLRLFCLISVLLPQINSKGTEWTENYIRLTNGVPTHIDRSASVSGGFITVPEGKHFLFITVSNPEYRDLSGDPALLGNYTILGRKGSAPSGKYEGLYLDPDPGVLSAAGGGPLWIENPAAGDYFVGAFSSKSTEKISSYTLKATYTPEPPVITSQPENCVVREGDTISFDVVASGESLSYQWYKDVTTQVKTAAV